MEKVGAYTDRATEIGEWRPGNPGLGQQATPMLAAYFNMLQRELVGVVQAAGLELDPEDDGQLLRAIRGGITTLAADTALTASHAGLLLLDASGGNRLITLPASNAALGVIDVIVRRTDNTGNRLKVQADGADKIKFHTHLSAAGYGFLYLMGAGDWWHLRSDGAGNWWPIGRHDSDALGRPVFETTTMVSPGGWGVFAGSTFNRADWPWMWDHAQQSGMLTTEAARVGMEGGWTSGDGAATFRGPEGRGEFLRVLDGDRGIDPARLAGSSQRGSLQTFDPDNNAKSVTGLTHTGDQTALSQRHGLDPTTAAQYPQSQVVSVDSGTLTAVGVSAGVVRPRNIAYPGRIKLI